MKEVQPGKYLAKVTDYGIGTTKEGLPQVLVMFAYKDKDQDEHSLIWFGSLKENAKPYTIDALLACGLKGNDLEVLADGVGNGALDTEKDVQITVEEHEWQGKKSMRIQWINEPGASSFRDKLTKGEAVQKMQGLNLKADVLARRQASGKKDQPAANLQAGIKNLAAESNEVPF